MENKAITPKEYEAAMQTISDYRIQVESEYKKLQKEPLKMMDHNKDSILIECNMSPRLWNILRAGQDELGLTMSRLIGNGSTVSDLSNVSVTKMLTIRNCGMKVIQELKNIATHAGITLKG